MSFQYDSIIMTLKLHKNLQHNAFSENTSLQRQSVEYRLANLSTNSSSFSAVIREMEKDREYQEIYDALTSLVTCSIVSHAIRHAYVKVCDIKEGPVIVTKQELMQDIKRDFRFVKGSQYRRNSQKYRDEIIFGSQYRRDEYTSPFLRDYQETALAEVNRTIQPHLPSYKKIKYLDLAGQLQHNSYELLSTLLENISGCPLEVLVLANNNITDDGLKILASKIRSFHYLHSLYLNNNQFGDDGIESLFHTDNFSSTLRILNIAYNKLGKTSAWSIGRMFAPGNISNLEELYVGGQVTYHYSIDQFFISFVPHILYPGARKLKRLDISASGLSLNGLSALITLISWTTSIEILNISQIAIEPTKYRYHFILALLVCIPVFLILTCLVDESITSSYNYQCMWISFD